MSKIPAFRAWHKTEQKMYRVLSLVLGQREQGVTLVRYEGPYVTCHLHEIELMQYTGLTDRNGTKIYEGDIVQRGYFALNDISKFGLEPWLHLPEGVNEGDITTVIEVWSVGTDVYDLCKLSEAVRSNPDVLGVEIIGNIYEHPHLLDKPQE